MKPNEKSWKIRPRHVEIQQRLSPQLGISPLLSQLLATRNITTPEEAEVFLSPKLSDLHSPFLMKDMEKTVKRISKAIKSQEEIVLYGDYDVDGVTGVSILLLFLRDAGARVSFFIPDRVEEGYGLHTEALKRIKEEGAKLIITVDCGTSDVEQVKFAKQQGMEVIITDHHEVPGVLPPAYAVLNPRRGDCGFPFDKLAGVGVVFNLLMALRRTLKDKGFWEGRSMPNLREYLDLVALGTIADVVPLIGENRILVKYGLKELTQGSRIGIKALKEVCGLSDAVITSHLVAFRLAPRINAPGRLSRARRSVALLTTDDHQEAQEIALTLEQENTQRQQIENRILKEACALIEADPKFREKKSIVLTSPEWHPGVVGICASRLLDRYYKPSVLIACDDKKGIGKGSARSSESFHLYEGLKECEHLLTNYGGHHSAAGLTIELDKLEDFKALFDAVVSENISGEEDISFLEIDAEVSLNEVSEQLVNEIAKLEPFGLCNPEPIFSSLSLDSYSSNVVGNGHLKLKIKKGSVLYDAIGFSLAEQFHPCLQSSTSSSPDGTGKIKIAFIPQFNTWQGITSIQLKITDIKCVDDT
jgi:single-stranded-DNA-specific exonuclease